MNIEQKLRALPGRPLAEFQIADIKTILEKNDGQCLYASCLGSRKTATTVAMAAITGGVWVVVLPLGTIGDDTSGWVSAVREWAPDADLHIMGTTNKTDLVDLQQAAPEPGKLSIHLVGWEYARRINWKIFKNIDGVALDEVHRMAGHGTATAKAVATMNARYRIGLSGTPANNKLHGLYNVLRWIWWGNKDHKQANIFRRFKNMWDGVEGPGSGWINRHFVLQEKYVNRGGPGPEVQVEIGPEKRYHSVVDEIPCYIQHLEDQKCCEFHPKGVNATLPQKVEPVVIKTAMTPAQAKLYRRVNDGDPVLWLDSASESGRSATVIGDTDFVKRIRLRQIALAVPSLSDQYVDGMGRPRQDILMKDDAKSSKADAILDLLQDIVEDDEPVMVYTHSKVFAKMLVMRINKRYGADIRAAEWSGDVSKDDRNAMKANFGKSGHPNVIVAVIASIAEGVDGLQLVCRREVWASEDESIMLNNQARGRLWRTGQERRVQSWVIVTTGTIEENIIKNHERRDAELKAALLATA